MFANSSSCSDEDGESYRALSIGLYNTSDFGRWRSHAGSEECGEQCLTETPADTFLSLHPSGQIILRIWCYGPQNVGFAASVQNEGVF